VDDWIWRLPNGVLSNQCRIIDVIRSKQELEQYAEDVVEIGIDDGT
jgi:hypothetical protein